MKSTKISPKSNTTIDLKNFDPDYHGKETKTSVQPKIEALQTRLHELQEMLYAGANKSLLIVLQAMDAGGKDGTIEHVFQGVNPQGVQVTSFKVPTTQELAHDFLWRIHQHVPPKGYIGIFNRSHYEDVLIVRVNKLVDKDVWQARYDHINHFEKLLADSGTRILKFYLHISKEEQKERMLARLADPAKHWKFSTGDLPVREQWDDYIEAYSDAITRCNTRYAPWHIIPANRKWYRNLVVLQTIVDTLEDMDLEYPAPEAGLDKIVIPD